MLGADLDNVLEAKSVQFERAGPGAAIVGLVDREDHRNTGVARGLGDFFVARDQTLAAVDDRTIRSADFSARVPRAMTSS